MSVIDSHQRPLRDLRISVTDRCNFRCTYCMPREVFGRDFEFLSRGEILSFEEIAQAARAFARAGVRKIRLTGGEPLLRRKLEHLVERLANIDGVDELALTTNGSLLTIERARVLKAAGLDRVTVSLDSLDDGVFRRMTDARFPVTRVLDAIDAALAANLVPVKVDVVLKRGVNDGEIIDLARRFRGSGVVVRFIEYMDVGNSNGWRLEEVVPALEVVETISRVWPLRSEEPSFYGEVARRWVYEDGAGEIGIVSSVTRPFCGSCTRARLTADGRLFLCLFAAHGHDLRQLVRAGVSEDELTAFIESAWRGRDDRYSELRTEETRRAPKVEMSTIGG